MDASYPEHPSAEILVNALRQPGPTARVLARLQHLLADPNSSLDDVSALLRLDAPLVAKVMRAANSVFFRRGSPCDNIDEAVQRLGFREIFRLVAIIAANTHASSALPAYGQDAEQNWKHTLCCALSCELIADQAGDDSAMAYTLGLLGNIGRLPINQFLNISQPGKLLELREFPEDYSHSEIALLGFTQAETGALMLKKWGFPQELVLALAHQYRPLAAPEPHDRNACLLQAGRLLASLQDSFLLQAPSEEETEILGMLRTSREALECLLPRLAAGMERVLALTAAIR